MQDQTNTERYRPKGYLQVRCRSSKQTRARRNTTKKRNPESQKPCTDQTFHDVPNVHHIRAVSTSRRTRVSNKEYSEQSLLATRYRIIQPKCGGIILIHSWFCSVTSARVSPANVMRICHRGAHRCHLRHGCR